MSIIGSSMSGICLHMQQLSGLQHRVASHNGPSRHSAKNIQPLDTLQMA
jgi:hypothetical protein